MDNPFYRTFSQYLSKRFGEKVYRISLDAGFTCPNRDYGNQGCAYCSEQGSWNGKIEREPLKEQVRKGKEIIKRRYRANKFIAYFQAYTNTYAPVDTLKKIYDSVLLGDEEFVGLTVGTRPDCIDRDKLKLISAYKERGLMVWVEYGLQSASDETLRLIGRGHRVEDFKRAVFMSKEYGLLVGTHVIIGLPGEDRENIKKTAHFLAGLPVDMLKIHNLNIVKDTLMAEWYYSGKVKPLGLEEYAELVVDFLELTGPDIIVDRLVAESNPLCLIEPRWSLNKNLALRIIAKQFETRESFQGKNYKREEIIENSLPL